MDYQSNFTLLPLKFIKKSFPKTTIVWQSYIAASVFYWKIRYLEVIIVIENEKEQEIENNTEEIIDLEGIEIDSQNVTPELQEELDSQKILMNELSTLLSEGVPKEEEEKFTQSQVSAKLGIPRSTMPHYIDLYEKITEPDDSDGKRAMRFFVRTKTAVYITSRGVQFLKLIRELSKVHKISQEYLQQYVADAMAKKPLQPTLNEADIILLCGIFQKMVQKYYPGNSAAAREKDKRIEDLSKVNNDLLENYELLVSENRKKNEELDAQNQALIEQNRVLAEQNQILVKQLKEFSKKEQEREEEPEKKGFFSRFFGL